VTPFDDRPSLLRLSHDHRQRHRPADPVNPSARDHGRPPLRVAVVGAGVSGLSAAWMLSTRHDVTLFETEARLGGHSNTLPVPLPDGGSMPVDTGFMVFNDVNYPNLVQLFDHLGVASRETDMSFAVSVDGGRVEYCGGGLYGGLFAQRRNLLRPRFLRMVLDIVRFYRSAPGLARRLDLERITLGELLDRRGYGEGLRADHLVPMASAIWSGSPDAILDFPAASFIRFFENHGLFRLFDRPQWRTVCGGSRSYVDRIREQIAGRPTPVTVHAGSPVVDVSRDAAGVTVRSADGRVGRFDAVVIGAHADKALAMLGNPSAAERSILGRFRYQQNRTLLHTDPTLMPVRRAVWASWNYLAVSDRGTGATRPPSVTYWMNRLQGLDPRHPAFVSLNPLREPAAGSVVAEMSYAHPQYDPDAMTGQRQLHTIQGTDRIWYCGSYFGYGFHEDGLTSGLNVAAALGSPPPWWSDDFCPAVEPVWTGVVRGAA